MDGVRIKGFAVRQLQEQLSVSWFSENEKTLDEVVTRDIPRRTPCDRQGSGPWLNQRVDRAGIEPANTCTPIGSQVLFQNDRRSNVSEVYGALSRLSYGAVISSKSRRWDSNPRHPAPEACTPTRQSIVVSICFYRSGRRGSRTLKARHASSAASNRVPSPFGLPFRYVFQ